MSFPFSWIDVTAPAFIFGLCCFCGIYAALTLFIRSRWLQPLWIIPLLLGMLVYTQGGTLHSIFPNGQRTQALFHFHDFFHYYMGAKYYPELQYDGLYEASLLADSRSATPHIDRPYIRDLSHSLRSLSREDALTHAQQHYLPLFTAERWQSFTKDYDFLISLTAQGWANTLVYDLGFNPPPSWCVIGTSVANLLPLTDDSGLSLYPALWLPLLDMALLSAAALLTWRLLGFPAMALLCIAWGTSTLSNMGWTGGSFLRLAWLAAFIAGFSFLQREQWMRAGLFLGVSVAAVVFPAIFLAGAGAALLWRAYDQRTFTPLIRLSLGVMLGFGLLFIASLLMFGWHAWAAFFQDVLHHKELFFVKHISFKRVVLFDPSWVPNQNFWWEDGLDRFRVWNERLWQSWADKRLLYAPLTYGSLMLALYLSRRLRVAESALLTGGLFFYFFEVPANYYYAYLAVFPAILHAQAQNASLQERLTSAVLLLAFFLLWGTLAFSPLWSPDDIVQNFYICIGFLVFFLLWLWLRLGMELWRQRTHV